MTSASFDSDLWLADALPDGDLRELALRFEMAALMESDHHRDEYLSLVSGARQSVEPFLRGRAPAHVLANALAPVLDLRGDFRKHVTMRGGEDLLGNKIDRTRLALAAAGTVVSLCLREDSNGS